MRYTVKQVLSESCDGKLTIADTKVQLIPCKAYGEKSVLHLISVTPETHIPNFKTVMASFNVESVSLVYLFRYSFCIPFAYHNMGHVEVWCLRIVYWLYINENY